MSVTRKSRSQTHVALLRGVNVGGKNRLPMKDLAAIFADAGCRSVTTYIQSGNAIFDAPAVVARGLPAAISRRIERRFGIRVPVVMRTAAELGAVTRNNPFVAAGADPSLLHVAFLADLPASRDIAVLDPDRSPPDELSVDGREIYLRLPNGVAKTKFSNAYFDAKLRTTSTWRSWRTVLELHALATGRG
ncbi:MAG: DUF1697 domain-containing protein [Acidobacteriota bacterium]